MKKTSTNKKAPTSVAKAVPGSGRAYYDSLDDAALDALWANRAAHGIVDAEERLLRHVLRERKGFKPADPFVSICQRCNLPADNCACHR